MAKLPLELSKIAGFHWLFCSVFHKFASNGKFASISLTRYKCIFLNFLPNFGQKFDKNLKKFWKNSEISLKIFLKNCKFFIVCLQFFLKLPSKISAISYEVIAIVSIFTWVRAQVKLAKQKFRKISLFRGAKLLEIPNSLYQCRVMKSKF